MRVTLSLANYRFDQRKGSVVIGPTVGLTGVVDTRFCRYRSEELVYPCAGSSFLVPLVYGSQRRYLSETLVGNRYLNSQVVILPKESRLPACADIPPVAVEIFHHTSRLLRMASGLSIERV